MAMARGNQMPLFEDCEEQIKQNERALRQKEEQVQVVKRDLGRMEEEQKEARGMRERMRSELNVKQEEMMQWGQEIRRIRSELQVNKTALT